MTLDIRTNNQSLRDLLAGPPIIYDDMDAACRTLEIPIQDMTGVLGILGKSAELWYGGKRWFYGNSFKRQITATGQLALTVHDPLFYFKRNPDDYYIKNMTATQGLKYLADRVGVKTSSLANTGAVFKALYYPGADPDKIAIDLLARTYQANGKKYWYRFDPSAENFGLTLFERTIPALLWAFQVGVNLSNATREESIEETASVVKLVNRETGKTVTKINSAALAAYGNMRYFEEVDKDKAKTMEKDAQLLLDKLSKVNTEMNIAGINPDKVIPQLFSADVIYVEEPRTRIIGAYHIKTITHTFKNDSLIQIDADIQKAPDIPEIQYEEATKNPAIKSTSNNSGSFDLLG